ncbi:MAG: phosphohydrolase [Bacillota bacterium]
MSNKTSVRDPVHNYIYMTDVEESVVQHPLFQRLRFISQNGVAYYTYPSNRHDRFLHSLGVMKLGGDIFLNATEDLSDVNIKDFLTISYQFIKEKAADINITVIQASSDFIEGKNQTFQKYGLNINEDMNLVRKELENESSNITYKFTRAVLFQSVRLACLLHDVGHFPYSHTIEYAVADYISFLQTRIEDGDKLKKGEKIFLDDYLKLKKQLRVETVNKAIHEMIGIKMLDEILPANNLTDFQRLCRSIAKQILTKQVRVLVLETLYEIVSGELDADRLDYSLRDPYSSGLELGQIDMERLLNNFTIVFDNGKFRILPKVQALSTIETFYHNRYLTYKYLIYHHSKVRMDQIVGEITIQLISMYFESNPKWIYNILDGKKFCFLWSKINGKSPIANQGDDNYYYCDEGWFNSLVKEIYLESRSLDLTSIDDNIKALLLLIETFIFRKTDNIVSLFKRYDKYLSFFDMVRSEVEKHKGNRINEREFIKDCMALVADGILDDFKLLVKQKYNVILLKKMTPPKSIEFDNEGNSKLKIVTGNNKDIMQLQRVSPYLESLRFMNDSDQLFHIFLIGDNIKINDTWRQIESELHKFLKDKYLEVN